MLNGATSVSHLPRLIGAQTAVPPELKLPFRASASATVACADCLEDWQKDLRSYLRDHSHVLRPKMLRFLNESEDPEQRVNAFLALLDFDGKQ